MIIYEHQKRHKILQQINLKSICTFERQFEARTVFKAQKQALKNYMLETIPTSRIRTNDLRISDQHYSPLYQLNIAFMSTQSIGLTNFLVLFIHSDVLFLQKTGHPV
ncbi:hypothetical protein L596_001796 [Steinernema carpocapsae]|uniref:Uncharacterized protein n=1 Tax=Steinernema carpocapsae TaxID=34508 RepID=A0A4U8UMM4_STECR|nr:hypothetical protein L596_001796 [Steinernema carpocapsae]